MRKNNTRGLAFGRSKNWRHVIGWLIFVGYELAFLRFSSARMGKPLSVAVYYVLNIGLFYVNAHVVLDLAFLGARRPAYGIAAGLLVVELAVYLGLKFLADYLLSPSAQVSQLTRFVVLNSWRGIYFIGFSVAYWAMLHQVWLKERNHQIDRDRILALTAKLDMENQLIQAEKAYLQHQISPHLLFNSLNFIYSAVHRVSAKGGQGVLLLSELLRHSLGRPGDRQFVPLEEEIGQLHNLVRLNELRFNDSGSIRIEQRGEASGRRIIPLLLATLVENMIKHGEFGDPDFQAAVRLVIEGEELRFETRNLRRRVPLYPQGGLGLQNIEKRLQRSYPGAYHFAVEETKTEFITTLELKL